MHWIPIPYWPLFCKMRETGNRLITLKSHYEFLTECNRYKLIARGFELPNRINLGDMELKEDIEQSLQYTSLANQGKKSNWLKKEIKVVTKNFQKGKQELIWGMGKWDGELAVARIENDLGRLEFSLERTKGNKIRFLLENKRHIRREETCGRDHQERDAEALINECRKYRARKRKKRVMNRDRKRRYRRKQRKKKGLRFKETWKEILKKSEDIVREEPQDHSLMDNTEVEWDQNKLDLIRKGQKFVPAPKRVDTVAKFNHFNEFARKLCLKVFFNKRTGRELANQQQEARDQEKAPWEQMNSFSPTPGENAVLERFLTELFAYLLNPKNRNKFKDNLSRGEREALKEMQKWNRDPENPRVIRVQDKGSRFVIDWRSRYKSKTLEYLQDGNTFRETDGDPNELISEQVARWADRWKGEEVLSEDECLWIKAHNPKPATVYANIKTHKPGWPYRFIMSARGTATEYLARWIEHKLKPYAQLHSSYIRETKSFLQYLERINDTRAPLGEGTRLNSWDIVNFYPNCNTQMRIEAVRKVVEDNQQLDLGVPVECVLEALEITMSSNNGKFANNFFTQINGATIGGPESASVTDIFGAIYIDPVAKNGGPIVPTDWKGYRDDTFNIEEEVEEQELSSFTEYLNSNILESKIKFTM